MRRVWRVLPFDVPLSMRELARRPRELTLLLLFGALLFIARISLLRLMTGVSANGSAILSPSRFFSTCNSFWDSSGLPSRSASDDLSSLDFHFRLDFSEGRIWTTSSLSPERRADLLP